MLGLKGRPYFAFTSYGLHSPTLRDAGEKKWKKARVLPSVT